MSREFREIVCMNCFDVFTVNAETNHPWKCTECRDEVVLDPTPEESDRILTGCEKSSPEEVDLDNDLIADLKQQLDTALADLENFRFHRLLHEVAGAAMMQQLDETEKRLREEIRSTRTLRTEVAKWRRSRLYRIWAWWTAATYAHRYGDRC